MIDMPGVDTAPRGPSRNGEFFAVDRRAWARACGLGINPAVAYLVLARGSGRDNRTSTWSVQAVEKYTSISRGRAQEALRVLERHGLIQVLREGTRPKYLLAPAHEVPRCEGHPPSTLDRLEQRFVDLVVRTQAPCPNKASEGWDYRNPRTIAKGLVDRGWLRDLGSGRYSLAYDHAAACQPDWIWLPNTIVTGAAGEVPPVELVRQIQDAMALRLFVDFYHAQNLREDGGINRRLTRQQYERYEVGRQGPFTVWGFRHKVGLVAWDGPTACHRREKLTAEEVEAGKNSGVDFFRRQDQLTGLGLIEWVPHLVESERTEAEIIHPVGSGGTDELQDVLGSLAHQAASCMLTHAQRTWAAEIGLRLVPVPHHVANIQIAGIAQLRYRPRTRLTATWWAELHAQGERHAQRYRSLIGMAAEAANVA